MNSTLWLVNSVVEPKPEGAQNFWLESRNKVSAPSQAQESCDRFTQIVSEEMQNFSREKMLRYHTGTPSVPVYKNDISIQNYT